LAEVVVKRGTDTARRDGTLGTPAEGEIVWATDDKVAWIGDGATGGGVPASKPSALLTLYASSSQDINALSSDNLMLWTTNTTTISVAQSGTAAVADIIHSTSSDTHKITFNVAGIYELSASIAVDATASTPTRWNGKLRFVVNGSTEIGPSGQGGYLREASGQDETGLSVVSFAYDFDAADYIYLKVDREATTSAAVDTIPYASTCYIKRLS